ncbi:MAG: translation initiation factor [Myxococcales bacterium]|nr:translation initiation factor [Myxococcales bacterium]
MSKRGGKKGKSLSSTGEAFANNALSGLSGLGEGLPSAPSPKEEPSLAAPPATKPRFPNKLVVRMEKKGRRGKTVTRISGVPTKELATLCKEMKKAFGCGAVVEEQDLVLLGDLVQRAVSWFEKAGASKIGRGT